MPSDRPTATPARPPGPVTSAAAHREFCRSVRTAFPFHPGNPASFRSVVVIVASSRGGSSLLFELLRSTGAFRCLEGEHSTLYKLYGLGLPDDPEAYDGTISADSCPEALRAALADEVTRGQIPEPLPGQDETRAYTTRIVYKLAQQWPACPLGPDELWQSVHDVLSAKARAEAGPRDYRRLFLTVVRRLRASGWAIDPWYYDIDPRLIVRAFPRLPVPEGPPLVARALEAPPFIVPAPLRELTDEDEDRPLLLKASLDAYRIPYLYQLFHGASLRFVHLTRNPAAAVNGLMDGWLSRGFFSHNLAGRAVLEIAGYSSRIPGGSAWWNFDLPPGWREVADRPLPDVCAAQWVSAHRAIVESLESQRAVQLRVRAEAVLDPARRPETVADILRFCEVSALSPPASRIVMATEQPGPGRWRRRATALTGVLGRPAVRDCADALGYGRSPRSDWT